MRLRTILSMTLGLTLSCTLTGLAQERGNWHATSKTAQAITGDVSFGTDKLMIDFLSFPVSQVRALTPAEISAAFDGADTSTGAGHLYRLSIPGDRRFLRKNTLCGGEDVQWMATYVAGKELEVAFFSNAALPILTPEALNSSSSLCGTYLYGR